ncbi:MAG: cytoplasmic protein [Chloroflexi bacterium]|nr:cytoplasmic protein [Chloroflexota bacterium]
MTKPDFVTAHQHSSRHRAEIEASEICGCFYCLKIYSPKEIQEWIEDEMTALCPHCGIDSVIGAKSGYPITAEFLQKMKSHWFDSSE